MDDKAKRDLHEWLGEKGFSGSFECLETKLQGLERESRDRICWMLWEGQFHSNKRIIEFLKRIYGLGNKHFKHHSMAADYLILGSMEFSTPRDEYAHRDIKAITVRLDWTGQQYHKQLEVRIIFRYGNDDGIRDRYVTFKL